MDKRSFLGECLGTFILTLFGCSSVACAVLFGEYGSIFQVGLVWGLAVTLAVYMTRYLSCAHLNPAVSVAMVLAGRMKAKKLPCYLAAQILGALVAGLVLYGLFSASRGMAGGRGRRELFLLQFQRLHRRGEKGGG